MKTATQKPESREAKATRELLAAGCVREKREDREGITRTGWWQDGCWLGTTAEYALEALKG
jgi:hypothetical protein